MLCLGPLPLRTSSGLAGWLAQHCNARTYQSGGLLHSHEISLLTDPMVEMTGSPPLNVYCVSSHTYTKQALTPAPSFPLAGWELLLGMWLLHTVRLLDIEHIYIN